MNKPTNHLRRYADRYRLVRLEDGVWYLRTRHCPRDGMTYEVYDYDDTHLAACLPPRAACNLLRRYPGVLTVRQDADDAMVLLFDEDRLHELADSLKLKRRRQPKGEQLRRLQAWGRAHAQEGLDAIAASHDPDH